MLWLGIWRGQNLTAFGRQLRQRQPRLWLRRLGRRLWMDHFILKPVGKVGCAASLSLVGFGLALACRATSRTFDANMKMIIVAVHRPDLGEPTPVIFGFA